MQISRILPLACAAAVLASLVAARADDNEAQLRARQALEQKIKELPPVTEETPAQAPKKKKSKKEAAQKPAPAQPAPNTPPVVQVEPGSAPKVVEPTPAPAAPVTSAPTAPVTPPPAVPVTPAPAVAAPEVHAETPAPAVTEPAAPTAPTVQTPAPEFSPAAPKPAEPDATEKARAAMNKKMSELPPEKEPAPAVATNQQPIEEFHPAKPTVQKPGKSLPPMEAPASSLPASKEQRLQQLLQLYKSDQITPQEYHDQRAKILSEP